MAEEILNLGEDSAVEKSFVAKATDPLISPNYSKPDDFASQYPTPLDPTEVLALCEEISLWKALPEERTALNTITWRELNTLAFTSGSHYVAFQDGYCPEEYYSDGDNYSVTHKNIGAKKTLSERDIMHSAAVAAGGYGINQLVGGFPYGEGLPGTDGATFIREVVRDAKEKYARIAMTLVMNGWDRLLVNGDATSYPLEFDGIENWTNNRSVSFHTNSNTASGTFSAASFDQFLAEGCATPTHIFGHPQAIQEMLSGYFQLGFAGSQVVNFSDGGRITPGFNFASFVNTGVGRLAVVADKNFRRTDIGGGKFQADLWPMRLYHNGEPLVYKSTQIPLSFRDLAPGCSAVSFIIWAATGLVIRGACAQSKYTSQFTGRIVSTCTVIG